MRSYCFTVLKNGLRIMILILTATSRFLASGLPYSRCLLCFFLFYGQMIGFEPTISFFITKLILYFQMFALCSMENRLSLIRTFEMKAFDLIYPPF